MVSTSHMLLKFKVRKNEELGSSVTLPFFKSSLDIYLVIILNRTDYRTCPSSQEILLGGTERDAYFLSIYSSRTLGVCVYIQWDHSVICCFHLMGTYL